MNTIFYHDVEKKKIEYKSGDLFESPAGFIYLLCHNGEEWFLTNLANGTDWGGLIEDNLEDLLEPMKAKDGSSNELTHLGSEFEITIKKVR